MLGFPGTVHDAPHHRDAQCLHARIAGAPAGHLLLQVRLDLLRHFLEECRRGAPASRAAALHAETWGAKCRSPSDCSTCWATCTSSVRSPPGRGVGETRIVSPMPSCTS